MDIKKILKILIFFLIVVAKLIFEKYNFNFQKNYLSTISGSPRRYFTPSPENRSTFSREYIILSPSKFSIVSTQSKQCSTLFLPQKVFVISSCSPHQKIVYIKSISIYTIRSRENSCSKSRHKKKKPTYLTHS